MSCLSSSNFHQQASPFPANTRMHLMATSLSCHNRVGGSNQRRVTLHTTIKRGEIRKNTCTRLVLLINNVAEIKDSLIISIHIYIFFFFQSTHLRFCEVDEGTFLLREVLGGPLLVLALILEDLDLVFAAEIVAAAAAAHVRHYCWPSDGHRLSCLCRSAT